MQTFLPYANFKKTATVLDDKRLFKQLIEARQLIALITHGKTKSGKKYIGWRNHPARHMWNGHAQALKEYTNAILREIQHRGKVKTSAHFFRPKNIVYPLWLGNKKFHAAHRAALLAKNPEYYSRFGWQEKPEIKYIWPKN